MSRYRLTGRLEEGELSELYSALRGEDEAVVIKLFHAKTSDARYGKELAETARMLAQVKGPGILRLLEMGLVKDRLAVVRQAVDGPTLGQVLQRLTTKEFILAPPLALSIVVQILDTVQLAHEAGAIHGALTPGNVTLTPTGAPAIFDFGALKALQAVPGLKKSFAGRGRDAYRAPEVVKGSTPTIESDIYSIGAILYELLTLREPVGDRTGTMSVRTASLPAPSRVDRRLNARLDPIVLRAMELVEARRFRSAAEFALALRNFLANNGGQPAPEETRRFLEPMRLRESTFNLGPVPFAEPFTLKEIRGADLPPVTEKTQLFELRPSFSGPGPLDTTDAHADTAEAAPAFADYEQDRDTARSSLITDPGETAPLSSSRIAAVVAAPAGMAEPTFDEGTDPGQAGPLEKGWEAPSGLSPPKPRSARSAPAPAAAVLASRPVLRNPRVKLVEDFSQPATEAGTPVDEPTDLGEPERASSDELTPAPADVPASLLVTEPPPPRSSGPKGLLPPPRDIKAIEITGPLEYAAVPAESNQAVPKALNTAERFLAMDARRRRNMLLVALGLAAIGALSFGLAVRKFGASREEARREDARGSRTDAAPPEPYDPAYRTVNGALKKYFGEAGAEGAAKAPARESDPPAADPAPPPAHDEPPPEDPVLHRPVPKERAAFLTLSSDVAAVVYIDDLRVKKKTPLVRYPVEPGLRHLLLETAAGERKALDVELQKGQVKKVDEHFKAPRGR